MKSKLPSLSGSLPASQPCGGVSMIRCPEVGTGANPMTVTAVDGLIGPHDNRAPQPGSFLLDGNSSLRGGEQDLTATSLEHDWRRTMVRIVGRIALLGAMVVCGSACSDSDDSSGSGTEACGVTCAGSATCSSSAGNLSGTAYVQGTACVLSNGSGTVTLSCNGTATFADSTGSSQGTWSGGGTSVTVYDESGQGWSCTITPPSGGEGGGGGQSYSSCPACVDANCADELAACDAVPECVTLSECVLKCTSDECKTQCRNTYPESTPLLNAYGECIEGPCGALCGESSYL